MVGQGDLLGAVREAVHQACGPLGWASLSSFAKLRDVVHGAVARGVPRAHIARASTEVHVAQTRRDAVEGVHALGLVGLSKQEAEWLLNHGCCPNFGVVPLTGKTALTSVPHVIRLAGGIKAQYPLSGEPPRISAKWRRYHGRPRRIAWLALVVRSRTVRTVW